MIGLMGLIGAKIDQFFKYKISYPNIPISTWLDNYMTYNPFRSVWSLIFVKEPTGWTEFLLDQLQIQSKY